MVIVVLLYKYTYSRILTNIVKESDIKTIPGASSEHAILKFSWEHALM